MASRNKVVIFALNCVFALKEMSSPNDLKKSLFLFKELGIALLLLTLGLIFILFYNNTLNDVSKLKWSIFLLSALGAIWLIKNTIYVICNVVNTLITDKYKSILSQEITCMDETCCIPGNVRDYRFLLYLSIINITAFLVSQGLIIYFEYFHLSFVSALFVLFSYAGFIHTNKRLYEISKLLNKNAKENNITKEESDWLIKTREFFRIKFAYVSMAGFVGAFLILLFTVLFTLGLSSSSAYLIFIACSISLGILLFISQISLRVIHITVMD